MAIYDYRGNEVMAGGGQVNYDQTVKGVCHRGYDTQSATPSAPENTLPAYKLAKQRGFLYVETDVSFTSDGIAVLLHDASINRTARNMDGTTISGTVNIDSITYAQALQYDFGIYAGAQWAGTPIPTLNEFLLLCKNLGLYPYIELKNNATYTQAQIEGIVDAVYANGLTGLITFISFSATYLGYVKNYDDTIRLGFLKSTAAASDISTCQGLQTSNNKVFYDTKYSTLTTSICNSYRAAEIPVEIWTVDNATDIINMNPYVSGVTSNKLIAGKVLYDANIEI